MTPAWRCDTAQYVPTKPQNSTKVRWNTIKNNMPVRTFHTVRCSVVSENVVRAAQTFQELAVQAKVQTNLRVCRSTHASMGLVTSDQVAKGDVLMRVPTTAAIVLDYSSGLRLPAFARWPRLRGSAAGSSDPLPWDILQALALVDGLAGDGGEFWQRYCDELLPAPEQLTLPMCWEAPRLAELQHSDIAQAAAAQQARLTALFPELMEPLAPDVPGWLQWAFACVRSRAFRVGTDAFAFIPFLDFANHAAAPANGQPTPTTNSTTGSLIANADFRMSATTSKVEEGRGGDDESFFELVALREIAPGEEATICYSGPEGYTNQRYMAQYGFVPRGGNPADRIRLDLDAEHQAAPLELARLQDLMGDGLFLAALRGTDPYLFAALKSLPLKDEDPRVMDAASIHHRTATRGDSSERTAISLLRQVEAQISEGTTLLEDDELMLAGSAGEQLFVENPRLAAAVAYRIERKRLLTTTATLLRAYAH
ncbi:hypothetical protein Vafri_9560 [Volvox africanus]|uniref:SET domain-containing protein n=1 Tax=Volvox africanus TaxID=51714 RepID=A0A8J4B990_9CHLO|nr:hypothetical protein Vafri_9560 [Volvox africanus]